MPKPACVKCKRFYRPYRNSVEILEQMPIQNGAKPGTEDEANWRPYKIWDADLWRCEGCGHELISGWGANPITEHYREEEFARWMPHIRYTINDC